MNEYRSRVQDGQLLIHPSFQHHPSLLCLCLAPCSCSTPLMSSSSSSSSAAGRHATLQSAARAVMAMQVQEQDESDVLAMLCLLMHAHRTAVIAPIATAAAAASGGTLTPAQLQSMWDDKLDRRVTAALGAAASSDGGKKGCGPLLVALQNELKSRCASAGGAASILDLLDALGSSSLCEWHARWSESFIPPGAPHAYPNKFGSTRDLVGACAQAMMQEWARIVREQVGSGGAKAAAALLSGASASAQATATLFRALIGSSSSLFFIFVHERIQPPVKRVGSGAAGKAARVARDLEIGAKHKSVLSKWESWAHATFVGGGGGGGDSGGGGGGGASGRIRRCKYASCLDREGDVIPPTSKFVHVRCSEGCASSYHPACYHTAAAEAEADAEALAAKDGKDRRAEEEEEGAPCLHAAAVDRGCRGFLVRVELRQSGKVLTRILSAAGADEAEEEDDDLDDDAGDECGGDEDPSGRALEPAAALASAAGLDGIVGRKFRAQRSGRSYMKASWSKLKGMRTLDDGTVLYADELEKYEEMALKAEKKKAAEEKLEAKRRREEAEAEARKTQPSSAAGSAPSSATAAKAKPFVFEVVVPLEKRPVQPVPRAAAAHAASTASGGSSVAAPPAAWSAPPPAHPQRNAFSALSDDSASSSGGGLNAWGGAMPASASSSSHNDGFSSFISVQTKKAKGGKHRGPGPSAEEVAQAQALAAEAKQLKLALKLSRREARLKAEAEAAEREAQQRPAREQGAGEEQEEGDGDAAQAGAGEDSDEEEEEADAGAPGGPLSPTRSVSVCSTASSIPSTAPTPRASDSSGLGSERPQSRPRLLQAAQLATTSAPASAAPTPTPTQARATHAHTSAASSSLASPSRQEGETEARASSVVAAAPLRAMPMAPRPVMAAIPALVPTPVAPVAAAALAVAAVPAPVQPMSVPVPQFAAPSRPMAAATAFAAPAAVPLSQAAAPAFAAAVPSPVPGPAPVAATAAAPVRPPTTLPLLDDLLSLESVGGAATSSTLLLRRLPAHVTAELLGSVFCQFGRLRVHLVLLVRHGLTGVLQYTSAEAATAALQAMRGRAYDLEVRRGTPAAFTATVERWTIGDLVFARTPLVPVAPPHTQVKLLGYGQATAAPGAPLSIQGDRSLFSFN